MICKKYSSLAFFVPFIFFLYIEGSFSQSINLEQLGSLSRVIGGEISSDISDVETTDNNQASRPVDESTDEPDEQEYGYKGKKDSFIVEPRPKIRKQVSPFGYDFFTEVPSTFSSSKSFFVPDNYVIGPGDVIKIVLFGNRNNRYELEVSNEGNILIPSIGPISASGLSFDTLKNLINEIISSQFIGTNASVTLGQLRSINIFVLGNAINPGMYTVSALTTMTNAIFTSGGLKPTGSLRNIQLKRKGKVISTIDFYDLLLNGDTSGDVSLKEGDVVFIPSITKTVAIAGEVNRANIYELLEEEDIDDLIKYAGGLKPNADKKSVEIERVNPASNSFKLINLDINSSSNTEVKNGDFISIYPVASVMRNAILITGHAKQPGFFPWKNGMKMTDLVSSYQNLLPMTDLNYVLIMREASEGYFNILQIDLESMFKQLRENQNSAQNIELMEKDEIIFFPRFLSLDLVTTELISDDDLSQGQREQLLEQYKTNNTTVNPITGLPDINQQAKEPLSATEIENNIFYRYSVYHYCMIPQSIGQEIVESGGNSSIASISGKERSSLEDIRRAQVSDLNKAQTDELSLTDVCRQQLIKPVLDLVKRQSTSSEKKKVISVFGNVFFPGEYPLTNNMVLNSAIISAGGLKDSTYTTDIELIRSDLNGKEYRISNNNTSVSDSKMMTTQLQSNDLVNIKKISRNIEKVQISGQVFFPGDYPISKNETLSSLIKRAGGFNDKAFPKAAVFQRQSLAANEVSRFKKAQSEIKRKLLLASQNKGVGQETFNPAILSQLDLVLGNDTSNDSLGRLVIDIEAILNGQEEDIILEDGDTLIIPKAQNTVSVIGEVFVANAHTFENRLNFNDYISLSGGTTEFADSSNAYIIKSDGSIIPPSRANSSGFFRSSYSSNNALEPGDTIVVPLKVDTFSGIRATTEITQVLYQLAVAAAAVSSFNN
jgi:protein involved in polysaccharide export with SLBB domain